MNTGAPTMGAVMTCRGCAVVPAPARNGTAASDCPCGALAMSTSYEDPTDGATNEIV
ncbi:hypothetical protein AB0K16_53970 [Nonomuraea jabiensis]|uniref:hypothetical protein n=1 Tax=Nonomuraea jabiensis TaxID=882448 RepID=UPI00344024A9